MARNPEDAKGHEPHGVAMKCRVALVAWRWPGNQEDVWPNIAYISRIEMETSILKDLSCSCS
jgi:hypothetical protein